MKNYLIYFVLGLLGLLMIFLILNLLMLKTRNTTSVWLSRGVYICGILCSLLNAVRVLMIYEVNPGAHFIANIIVLISIVVSFIRSERKNKDDEV